MKNIITISTTDNLHDITKHAIDDNNKFFDINEKLSIPPAYLQEDLKEQGYNKFDSLIERNSNPNTIITTDIALSENNLLSKLQNSPEILKRINQIVILCRQYTAERLKQESSNYLPSQLNKKLIAIDYDEEDIVAFDNYEKKQELIESIREIINQGIVSKTRKRISKFYPALKK